MCAECPANRTDYAVTEDPHDQCFRLRPSLALARTAHPLGLPQCCQTPRPSHSQRCTDRASAPHGTEEAASAPGQHGGAGGKTKTGKVQPARGSSRPRPAQDGTPRREAGGRARAGDSEGGGGTPGAGLVAARGARPRELSRAGVIPKSPSGRNLYKVRKPRHLRRVRTCLSWIDVSQDRRVDSLTYLSMAEWVECTEALNARLEWLWT